MSKADRLSRAIVSDRALRWTTRRHCLMGLLNAPPGSAISGSRVDCGGATQCRAFRGDRLMENDIFLVDLLQPTRRLRHRSIRVTRPLLGFVQLASIIR